MDVLTSGPADGPARRARPVTGGAGPAAGPRRTPPPKLYRMGELVDHAGVSRQTIHNYTTMGLITEARRTSGGHRLYDETVFGRLEQIAAMKQQNRTMREIRAHFDHKGRRS